MTKLTGPVARWPVLIMPHILLLKSVGPFEFIWEGRGVAVGIEVAGTDDDRGLGSQSVACAAVKTEYPKCDIFCE
jgi:hypothetical protein